MNAALDRVSPSITAMIRMDHTHVMAAFHRYKADVPPGRKQALVRHACLALEVHTQLEEEIFYPALREVLPDNEVLDKAQPEHQEMRRLIDALRGQHADDPGFDANVFALMRIMIHHIADEESVLLPEAERLLHDRLSSLGAQMARRRMQLLKPHAGEMASTAVQTFPAGAAALAVGALAVGAMLFARARNGARDRWLSTK